MGTATKNNQYLINNAFKSIKSGEQLSKVLMSLCMGYAGHEGSSTASALIFASRVISSVPSSPGFRNWEELLKDVEEALVFAGDTGFLADWITEVIWISDRR